MKVKREKINRANYKQLVSIILIYLFVLSSGIMKVENKRIDKWMYERIHEWQGLYFNIPWDSFVSLACFAIMGFI